MKTKLKRFKSSYKNGKSRNEDAGVAAKRGVIDWVEFNAPPDTDQRHKYPLSRIACCSQCSLKGMEPAPNPK